MTEYAIGLILIGCGLVGLGVAYWPRGYIEAPRYLEQCNSVETDR